MKVVIAPDSFKGSLSAIDACQSIIDGLTRVYRDGEFIPVPMADGGEGTVDALVTSTGGQYRSARVSGPLGEPVEAVYGILGADAAGVTTAVIEMAAASGLPLVPEEKRNPLKTTTYGLGQLILHAYNSGCRNFLIGLGGSATNDCGAGMAQALGVRFMNSSGREITSPLTGGLLQKIVSIDTSPLTKKFGDCTFNVACDVKNPLLGPEGATYTFSPQKGATPDIVKQLELNMTHFIDTLETALAIRVRDVPGAGAAGGLGAGLMAFLGAKLLPGIEIVLQYSSFAQKIAQADLIITGEGKIDETTMYGKTISGIAGEAARQKIPVIALAGLLGRNARKTLDLPLAAVFSICPGPISLEQAMQDASLLLADTAEQVFRLFLWGNHPPRV